MIRRAVLSVGVVCLLAAAWHTSGDSNKPDSNPNGACQGTGGQFGTSVNFVSTPSEAGRLALKEEKLVLVLHVSGHFEDPKFT
jgi:hypothetical protein